MAQPIVRLAKLSRPNLTGVVSRDRLFSRLDAYRESRVIWVAGPAGSGKTTLVADYLDTFALDYGWYQLDRGDADVATFFYYLSQAIERADAEPTQPIPTFAAEYIDDIAAFTRRFFRAFFAQLTTPFALVFDNYHEIPTQSRLHEVIRQGLDEIPDGGCVIVIGRSDPPPSFVRLRANQQLATLGWNELRLTREESDAIVETRSEHLPDSARSQLYERTQGWAAGTVLMLEHMRREGSVADVPATLTPNTIFDYLAGEVFKNLETDQQQFLLQTSILAHVTPSLADALTDRTDSSRLLEHLSRHDQFVSTKQTKEGTAFQFHPLLGEFLQKRATEVLGVTALAKARTRAAALLEQTGNVEDAIRLRVENHEWAEVVRLIREHAFAMLSHGRGETLERWLEELPRDRVRSDPWLLYWLGACRLHSGPREARRHYERAFELFKAQDAPEIEGLFRSCAGVLGAILYDLDDMTLLDRWIAEVQNLHGAYPNFPAAEYGEWLTCHMYMALVLRQPFHPEIEQWAERTYEIFRRAQDIPVRLQAAIVLVSGIVWTGRFAKVTEIIESIRRLADRPEEAAFVLATLHVVESMNYMLDGQYERCLKAVRDGLEVADVSGIHIWENSTLLNGVGGALAEGDLETAEEFLGQIDGSALRIRRFDSCIFQFFSSWLALLKGDVLEAYQQQKTALRLATDMGLPFFEVIGSLAMAQILCESGDKRRGAMYLRDVRRVAKTINNRYLEFMSLLFYAALALEHSRRRRSGLNALAYAFRLGRENGYTNTVWWQPTMMAKLVTTALEHDIEVTYARSLARKRNLVPASTDVYLQSWPWRYRVHAFGQFQLERDEHPDAFRGKHGKPLELLQVTIALGARDVVVDRITDTLWPRIDADYAYRSFNTTLHRLRKLLGHDQAIVLQGGRLSLNPQWFWLDLWAFEHCVSEATAWLREPGTLVDHERLSSSVDRALALYRGPFMADANVAWALATRKACQSKFVRLLANAARFFLDVGRKDRAVALLEQGLEADDLAEGLYRQLMLCYHEIDRRMDAIEAFNRCRVTLSARLDAEPSPETLQIFKQLTVEG